MKNHDVLKAPEVCGGARADSAPDVSVVIPCRNEAKHIGRCIEGILHQLAGECRLEVIVVDGLSTDGTREILAEWIQKDQRVVVVDNHGRIVSTGLNAGIRAARGSVIVRMDAHTIYADDYVGQCVSVLHQTSADVVGGPWLARGDSYLARAIAAAFQCRWVVGGARSHQPNFEGEVDSVYLGCWRRGAFDQFGFFDETLVRNQDDELNLRIRFRGGRVWQSPRIRSWYVPRGSLSALWRQYSQYGYWKVRVMKKHRRPAALRHLVPACFVLLLLLLSAATPISTVSAGLLVATIGAYLIYVIGASIATASSAGWTLLPVLPVVIGCYHIGYGFGFLVGLLDTIVRRRGEREMFTAITRN